MKNMKNEMKNLPTHCPPLLSTQVLLNNEVNVTSHHSRFCGRTGRVANIMADGRTLDVVLRPNHDDGFKRVLLDVTLVSEIQEPVEFAKGEPDLGPIANSVVQAGK
jgi:hypothetical protein